MSIFPTKILLATDGSRDAEAAATAVGLAKITGSELHDLHMGSVAPEHFEPTVDESTLVERVARRIRRSRWFPCNIS
jgi:hypothetical protein